MKKVPVRLLAILFVTLPLTVMGAAAQQRVAPQSLVQQPATIQQPATPVATQQPTASPSTATVTRADPGYVLGPNDQIIIRALDAEEISDKPFLIGTDGDISLPMIGRMHAAGLTVEQFESETESRLKTFLKEPQVSVNVVEFGSQPVSVIGAVTNPGVVQLRGEKTLFEVISAVGGLKTEAGNTIKVTRRKEFGPLPLPGATPDSSGEFSVAEVSVKSVMDARNPQENIEVKPHDVISVPRAQLVYVVGAVNRPGGFVLNERDSMSVLQAVSMAEGLVKVSAPKAAVILRSSDSSSSDRTQIPVNVTKILAGKTKDVPLQANDILFIPESAVKSATYRGLEAALQTATGVAIWRF